MEENYKVCDFYQHAFCIAEEIINFDYDICTGQGYWDRPLKNPGRSPDEVLGPSIDP